MTRQPAIVRHPFVICAAVLLCVSPAWAETMVVSVEEHWELQLSQPDAERSAPQTTMVMSPDGDLADIHFLFTLNHHTVPSYRPGGMQVQLWDAGQFVQESAAADEAVLQHSDEVVRWTQRISLEDGTLTFQVVDGQSETWQSFGGAELSLSVSTSLTGLNSYRPGISLTESQVGYAENRVASLVLTKLVWVTDDGEVHEQNAPIPIDTSLDP